MSSSRKLQSPSFGYSKVALKAKILSVQVFKFVFISFLPLLTRSKAYAYVEVKLI